MIAKMMMAKRRSSAMLTRGPMALAMEDMTTCRPARGGRVKIGWHEDHELHEIMFQDTTFYMSTTCTLDTTHYTAVREGLSPGTAKTSWKFIDSSINLYVLVGYGWGLIQRRWHRRMDEWWCLGWITRYWITRPPVKYCQHSQPSEKTTMTMSSPHEQEM